MKNILITGGAGFIGSTLSLSLISNRYNVTVLDNLSEQIHGEDPETKSYLFNLIKNKINFIKGDVSNRADWLNALKNQDIVIHLAAETGTGQSMYEIERYVNINTRGTAILADILVNETHKIKKVILASSRAVYGEGKYYCKKHGIVYPDQRDEKLMSAGDFDCKCPICNSTVDLIATTEDSKINPTSIYGITKYQQEQILENVLSFLNISLYVYRFQNVYGVGQALNNPYTGILSIFSNLILNDKPINIFEDGLESRDFIYIDDIVSSLIAGLQHDLGGINYFNVGTGVATNVIDVAEELYKNYKVKPNYSITGNFRVGDIRHNFADITQIQNKLNFAPTTNFSEGIRKFCNWVLESSLNVSKYEESLNELKKRNLLKK
jgi:dTDP-L-rhamnose 4-epimerase